jgi:voltage-gated potassium channel Kch
MLATLAVLGGVVPGIGLIVILGKLTRDRQRFRLRMLLEAYLSLILIFASGYAVLQASSLEPSVSGMELLWESTDGASLGEHVWRLHEVFLDGLYLSVMTITTVGYGDLLPLSPWAKTLSALEGVAGIGFIGVALGHYFSVCLHRC